MLRRNDILWDRTHPLDANSQWWIKFQEIQIQRRRHYDHNRLRWEGHCDQQSDRFLKLTPLLHVSLVTRKSLPVVVVSKMCVELIGLVQDHPVQSAPFISKANLLWKAFRYPKDIDFRFTCMNFQVYPRNENRGEKKKSTNISMQQTTNG